MFSLLEVLRRGRPPVSDGARSTFLHQRRLKAGEGPELRNVTRQDNVATEANSAGGGVGTGPEHSRTLAAQITTKS